MLVLRFTFFWGFWLFVRLPLYLFGWILGFALGYMWQAFQVGTWDAESFFVGDEDANETNSTDSSSLK